MHHAVILELNIPSYRLEHSSGAGGKAAAGKASGKKEGKTTA